MNLRFRLASLPRRAAQLGLLAGGALLASSCRHESVAPEPVSTSTYFPVVVGTYRTYAVADSNWTGGVATVRTYQLRERVAEQFADAAGQPAYRVVRSKRLTATAAWVDDSVLVVQPLARAVLLTRANVRTVELIYPPRAGKGWNATAFTTSTLSPDTITNVTRQYGPAVGAPFTTSAGAGQAAKTYDATVAVLDIPGVQDNDGVYRRSGTTQVFASGVGLVLRRRYSYYTYYLGAGNQQIITPSVVQSGAARRETLLETGTL